jgi:hypothetical protein
MSRAPTPNIVVGTLLAAIFLGLLAGCLAATKSSIQWPPQAAQVLVTLLVAAAVEQKTLPNELLGWLGTAVAIPLVCGVAAAIFLSPRPARQDGDSMHSRVASSTAHWPR